VPAISADGKRFLEGEILIPAKYALMKSRQLWLDSDSSVPVIPVRKRGSPHFRRLSEGAYRHRVSGGEQDETHGQTIKALMRVLQTQTTSLLCPTFDEAGNLDSVGTVLLERLGPSDYAWYSDGVGTRIPLSGGRYIQPDICGWPTAAGRFWPTAERPAVIIEVVQRHLPETAAFIELVRLSAMNFLVVLYFVATGRKRTKYSRYGHTADGVDAHITAAHFVSGRCFYENGQPKGGPAPIDENEFAEWYSKLDSLVLSRVMKNKEELAKQVKEPSPEHK